MIYSLEGKIVKSEDTFVVLENNNGVGYQIFCKAPEVFKTYIQAEKIVKFYIFEHITENNYLLYGFRKEEELKMLRILISVKNIGPKVGLNILNSVTIGNIIRAIEEENPKLLPKIKGVGPKAKQRMVNELKGKIPEELMSFLSESKIEGKDMKLVEETLEGLMALGLEHTEAMESIENAPEDIKDTGELIKWALKNKN